MVAGEYLPIVVGVTDTPSSIASAIAAAINGYYDVLTKAMLPVTAAASGATVTVTARHAGAIMNEVDFWTPSLGGQNLFAAAGARFAFDEPSLAPLMDAIGAELSQLAP